MMITILISVSVTVAVVLAVNAIMQKKINARGGCPNCGTPVPRYRLPTSFRQSLWGGWTCAECGTDIDRYGKELSSEQ